MTTILQSIMNTSCSEDLPLKEILAVQAPELTVIVPTFNEHDNVIILIDRLRKTLEGYNWEVIFVDDDSPDGTADLVKTIGKLDCRIRCIRRISRRGLSGAFLEGALASQASYIAVIDGDLQHDETRLPMMLKKIRDDMDLVVATRYAIGGSLSSFSLKRERISRWGTALVQRFLGVTISDPMSGFFMIRRSFIELLAPSLKTQGFKILLDIITTARGRLRIAEIPYSFGSREHGESKLDTGIILDFVSLLIGKLSAGFISARFLLFCFVGFTGLGLHILLLNIILTNNLKFDFAQTLSTIMVVAYNFSVNNILTYGDKRLSGKHFILGLLQFEVICSISLIANVGIAHWIYGSGNSWWLAGIGGALMGAVWNYLVSANYVWRK